MQNSNYPNSDAVLSSIFQGLNPVQRLAVVHKHAEEGPLLLLAGAGSGKTSVLIRRIQWNIACENVPATQILGLTFTAKAAAEMLERLEHSLGAEGAKVQLCTFHSLAFRLIKEDILGRPNWKRLGFAVAPKPIENAGEGWEEALAPLKVRFSREEMFNPHLPSKVQQAILPLQKACFASGGIVFEDLIWLAQKLIFDHPDVAQFIRQRWSTLLVDEYQDINPSQYQLVRAILGDSKRLFVVGDDDQAIYGFRGADIGNIHRFKEDYLGCKVLYLESNYRSTYPILDLANQIFKKKPLELRKRLRPASLRSDALFTRAFPVEIWKSPSPWIEFAKIMGTIEKLRLEFGLDWKAFAILVRFNRQKDWYERAFASIGVQGVAIETIHASKGLQYPVVFYCGLAKNLSPAPLRGSKSKRQAQLAEEQRLFYVGVTRAESRLYLLFCSERFWQGKLQQFKESPFLRYLPPAFTPTWSQKIPMLIKIIVILKQMVYMSASMVQFLFVRIFNKAQVNAWVDAKLDAWARFSLRILSMDLRPEGTGNAGLVDWNRPVFVIANHQSYSDIPTILVSLQRKLGFVAKKELGRIPFLGYWMLQIGCLMIERGKAGVGNEVNDTIRRMPKAPNLVIFPEGTRSKNGKLNAFKSGAFRMAIDHEGIVLPLIIHGTRDGWENRKTSGSQEVVCKILPPLDVKTLREANPNLTHKDLMNLARASMEANLH